MPDAKTQTTSSKALVEHGLIYKLVSASCSSGGPFTILISVNSRLLWDPSRIQHLLIQKSACLFDKMKAYIF